MLDYEYDEERDGDERRDGYVNDDGGGGVLRMVASRTVTVKVLGMISVTQKGSHLGAYYPDIR